jgi:hypothetical protein
VAIWELTGLDTIKRQAMKALRMEKLAFHYRFWLPGSQA